MSEGAISGVQKSYDSVAAEYVRRIYDELRHKPLDRELLDRFADRLADAGLVCDMGTGPGHVARYLNERGLEVCGIDLAAEMIEHARRLNPGIDFRQGNMFQLELPNEHFAGMTAIYAIVNIPPDEVVRALRELNRVLRPNGLLLLAFHLGEEVLHRDELWGVPVSLDFHFFGAEEMAGYLVAAAFEIEEIFEREPYPEVEHPSRRAYIFARKICREMEVA